MRYMVQRQRATYIPYRSGGQQMFMEAEAEESIWDKIVAAFRRFWDWLMGLFGQKKKT